MFLDLKHTYFTNEIPICCATPAPPCSFANGKRNERLAICKNWPLGVALCPKLFCFMCLTLQTTFYGASLDSGKLQNHLTCNKLPSSGQSLNEKY